MAYIALYWHIINLYFRRFILKKTYEPISIINLDLPYYTKAEHLQKANFIWSNLNKEKQELLLATSARLQENPLYIAIVDEARIAIKYLPLLNAISEGITRLYQDGLEYNFATNNSISYLKRGLEELSFFQDTLYLIQHWILPYPLYAVYEAYIREFGYYGGMDIIVERAGISSKKMPFFYNITAALLHLHPKHEQLLEAYWNAMRMQGFATYYKQNYKFPFLSQQMAFEKHIKTILPFHKSIQTIDLIINTTDLLADYEQLNTSSFLKQYEYKNMLLIGKLSQHKFIKLLDLANTLEKQKIYPRTFMNEKFGLPYIFICDEMGRNRIKVFLKSETYIVHHKVLENQTIRVSAIFTNIAENGCLIFEQGLISN